jgi:hypothetical protein
VWTANVGGLSDHICDGSINLRLDAQVLRVEINEWDFHNVNEFTFKPQGAA